jgi:hypothetical protein
MITHRSKSDFIFSSSSSSFLSVNPQGATQTTFTVIPPERLRALLVAEAETGERIMRALILRRVGLIETGAGGPVIVGSAGNGDVLRLGGFLSRNGHPHQRCCARGGRRRPRRWPGTATAFAPARKA